MKYIWTSDGVADGVGIGIAGELACSGVFDGLVMMDDLGGNERKNLGM